MSVGFREEGRALYDKGDYASALEAFLSANEDNSLDSELAYYIGLCRIRLGEHEKARAPLEQVLNWDQSFIRQYQARMLLSWLLVEAGEIKAAENHLRGVLHDGFQSPQAYSALGYCQWCQGHTAKALESYRKALALDMENPTAVNGLGYLLAESGEDPQEAVALCRKAVKAAPDNMAYRDSLGWALFRIGRVSEAIGYLTEALIHRPEERIIKEHLEAVKNHEQHKSG